MKAVVRDLGTMEYTACWDLQRKLFEELTTEKRGADDKGAREERGNKEGGSKEGGSKEGPDKRGASEAEGGEAEGSEVEGSEVEGSEVRTPRRDDEAGTILLVEHPPVYTLGKSGHAENLLVDTATLERLGAKFFHIDRGGDITFHGPGQIVCYPILDLERLGIGLREYIDRIEEAVIRTVAHYGVAAGRIPGASGVWLTGAEKEGADKEGTAENGGEEPDTGAGKPDTEAGKPDIGTGKPGAGAGKPRKICAIGVRSSRYVTMHGFALNVTTDLEWFMRINPCGFRDRGVTSLARETGRKVPMDEVKRLLLRELAQQFGMEVEVKK